MMQSLKKLIAESASRFCGIYRAENGKWYLDLAQHEFGEPQDAQTYGPFRSFDSVVDYLHNFPNPGGWTTDASGERPVPTVSPNGKPVQLPTGPSGGQPMQNAGDPQMTMLVRKALRDFDEEFGQGNRPTADQVIDDVIARAETKNMKVDLTALRGVVAGALAQRFEKQSSAPPPGASSVPPPPESGEQATKATKAAKTSYRVYGGTGGTGKTPAGASSIHTRIKGKVYMPTAQSQFNVGDTADTTIDGNNLILKKPDSDHTQTWAAREGVERVVREMIKLLK